MYFQLHYKYEYREKFGAFMQYASMTPIVCSLIKIRTISYVK